MKKLTKLQIKKYIDDLSSGDQKKVFDALATNNTEVFEEAIKIFDEDTESYCLATLLKNIPESLIPQALDKFFYKLSHKNSAILVNPNLTKAQANIVLKKVTLRILKEFMPRVTPKFAFLLYERVKRLKYSEWRSLRYVPNMEVLFLLYLDLDVTVENTRFLQEKLEKIMLFSDYDVLGQFQCLVIYEAILKKFRLNRTITKSFDIR